MNAESTARLAGYLQGTLSPAEHEHLLLELEHDPNLRTDLRLLACIREAVREEEIAPSSEDVLATALARIRSADHRPETVSTTHRSVSDRVGSWLMGVTGLGRASPFAFASVVVVMLAQFGVIAGLLIDRDDDYAQTRSRSAAAPNGPFIKVSLRAESTEAEVRFLLVSVGAMIVGGPTTLGDYYLYVPPERVDHVVQQIRQSRAVDQAEVIVSLPVAKE